MFGKKQRTNRNQLHAELESKGFTIITFEERSTIYRFATAEALFDHSLIRIVSLLYFHFKKT